MLPGATVLLSAASVLSAALGAGTPLPTALEELRRQGLPLLYSTVLVEPSMQVLQAPRSGEPLAAAHEMLAPHGLGLKRLRADLYVVVRTRGGARSTISGQVVDAVGGTGIGRARIEADETGLVCWTRADGRFVLRGVPPGRHALRVSAEGYGGTSTRLVTPSPAPILLLLRLPPADPDLAEVVVSASRYIFDQTGTASLFSLDRGEVRAHPSLGEDALQSVARLPGFAFSGFSARPNIRGGEAGEALILLDGMPIRQAFHMPAYNSVFSVLDDDLIARIETFTGAFPPRHGNRLSGILEVETRDAGDPPHHALGLSVFNAEARTSGRTEAGTLEWLASGRLGALRPLLHELAPDVGSPSYGDVFAKLRWHADDDTQLRLHALWSNDELVFHDAETGERAELESRASYVWLTGSRALREDLVFEALIGLSSLDSLRAGTVVGGLTLAGELRDVRSTRLWDLRTSLRWQASARHTLEAGLLASRGTAHYDHASHAEFDAAATALFGTPQEMMRAHRIASRRENLALHASDRWRLGERWFLDIGARLEHERDDLAENRTSFGPRLAVRWDAGRATLLRASWARVQQRDELHDLQIEDGLRRFQPAQRADHLILGIEHRLRSGVALRLEAFRKDLGQPRRRFENLFDPLRFLPELSADRIRVAPEAVALRGVELSAQWEQGPWALSGAWSWSRHLDRIAGRDVLRPWDQTHTGSLALAWRRGPWSVAALGSFHTGRPTTPIDITDPQVPKLGARNSKRLPAYASVDARVMREFPLVRGRLTAYAQITNLFGRANRCCTEVDIESEEGPQLQLEPLYSYPALPAVGVTWEF